MGRDAGRHETDFVERQRVLRGAARCDMSEMHWIEGPAKESEA
jgi:hypothetical protein